MISFNGRVILFDEKCTPYGKGASLAQTSALHVPMETGNTAQQCATVDAHHKDVFLFEEQLDRSGWQELG